MFVLTVTIVFAAILPSAVEQNYFQGFCIEQNITVAKQTAIRNVFNVSIPCCPAAALCECDYC
jgi:hypothetical protein